MSQLPHLSRVPLVKPTTRLPLYALLAAAVLLASCASPPTKPAVPDGSSRVTANDPARIAAIQQQVVQDRTALTENNVIRAQVDDMRNQIDVMRDLLRSAFSLPPETSAATPATPESRQQKNAARPHVPAAPDPREITSSGMPARSYDVIEGGVVVRVFYPYGKTQFVPTDDVARILLDSAKTANSIEIRGLTDNAKMNNADREIARARAVSAWRWLVARGVDPAVMLTRYQSAGNYLVPNDTPAGRAMNRRAEVVMLGDRLKTFVFVDPTHKETP